MPAALPEPLYVLTLGWRVSASSAPSTGDPPVQGWPSLQRSRPSTSYIRTYGDGTDDTDIDIKTRHDETQSTDLLNSVDLFFLKI